MTDLDKPSRPLTARQQEILDLIEHHVRHTGFPPTRLEICKALGFRSPNAAEEHLRALARKGVIEMTAGASRGIRLVARTVADTIESIQSSVLELPLVGRVAAGSPILAQAHIEQRYTCDPALFSLTPDYLLKVRGMSMRDAGILDGDLLAVRRFKSPSEARNGQIVVARIGDEVTVKRYQRHPGHIELIAENPDYRNILVETSDESFSLEGLSVGLIRNTTLS